jgi:56kDa selenium binding protein (SBP56)
LPGPSKDGKIIWGGGLLSLLKTQDTGYYFDTTDPYNPSFKKSDRAILASIADEIRAKPDGGFFITYMGSAVGTAPGRLIETDAEYNIIHEWPEDTAGTLNILGQQFSPHGLSIDWNKGLILTSDFVVPITVLKPSTGIQHANTLRLWDLESRTIKNTITIPNVSTLCLALRISHSITIGRRHPRRQVHPWQPRQRSSCHRRSSGPSLDHLPIPERCKRQARKSRATV